MKADRIAIIVLVILVSTVALALFCFALIKGLYLASLLLLVESVMGYLLAREMILSKI